MVMMMKNEMMRKMITITNCTDYYPGNCKGQQQPLNNFRPKALLLLLQLSSTAYNNDKNAEQIKLLQMLSYCAVRNQKKSESIQCWVKVSLGLLYRGRKQTPLMASISLGALNDSTMETIIIRRRKIGN